MMQKTIGITDTPPTMIGSWSAQLMRNRPSVLPTRKVVLSITSNGRSAQLNMHRPLKWR